MYYPPTEYAQPHPDLDFTIHPDSAVAQLGLTQEELAPILQEQQEFLNSLDSMGYKPEQQQYLRDELTQPLADLDKTHHHPPHPSYPATQANPRRGRGGPAGPGGVDEG